MKCLTCLKNVRKRRLVLGLLPGFSKLTPVLVPNDQLLCFRTIDTCKGSRATGFGSLTARHLFQKLHQHGCGRWPSCFFKQVPTQIGWGPPRCDVWSGDALWASISVYLESAHTLGDAGNGRPIAVPSQALHEQRTPCHGQIRSRSVQGLVTRSTLVPNPTSRSPL